MQDLCQDRTSIRPFPICNACLIHPQPGAGHCSHTSLSVEDANNPSCSRGCPGMTLPTKIPAVCCNPGHPKNYLYPSSATCVVAQFQEGQKRGLLTSQIDFSACMMVALRLLGRGYRCPALGVVPASSVQAVQAARTRRGQPWGCSDLLMSQAGLGIEPQARSNKGLRNLNPIANHNPFRHQLTPAAPAPPAAPLAGS